MEIATSPLMVRSLFKVKAARSPAATVFSVSLAHRMGVKATTTSSI